MTPTKRAFLWWWLSGLAAFGVAIYLHLPLVTEGVPGGISDHQRAPDAATVNAIQRAWRLNGLSNDAAIAMISDLIFIGIYGTGCVLGGLYFRARNGAGLRLLGWVALIAGAAFLAADYGETVSELIQLMRFEGDDGLAQIASTLRPIKTVSFIAAFLALIASLIVERLSTSDA